MNEMPVVISSEPVDPVVPSLPVVVWESNVVDVGSNVVDVGSNVLVGIAVPAVPSLDVPLATSPSLTPELHDVVEITKTIRIIRTIHTLLKRTKTINR
jgi:hypothetical protein